MISRRIAILLVFELKRLDVESRWITVFYTISRRGRRRKEKACCVFALMTSKLPISSVLFFPSVAVVLKSIANILWVSTTQKLTINTKGRYDVVLEPFKSCMAAKRPNCRMRGQCGPKYEYRALSLNEPEYVNTGNNKDFSIFFARVLIAISVLLVYHIKSPTMRSRSPCGCMRLTGDLYGQQALAKRRRFNRESSYTSGTNIPLVVKRPMKVTKVGWWLAPVRANPGCNARAW